jgi:hypothetical protein
MDVRTVEYVHEEHRAISVRTKALISFLATLLFRFR